MSNREELISKVVLAPCGVRIRGVELGNGKMRKGEEERSGEERRNYFILGDRFAILQLGRSADEWRGGRGGGRKEGGGWLRSLEARWDDENRRGKKEVAKRRKGGKRVR